MTEWLRKNKLDPKFNRIRRNEFISPFPNSASDTEEMIYKNLLLSVWYHNCTGASQGSSLQLHKFFRNFQEVAEHSVSIGVVKALQITSPFPRKIFLNVK